MAAMTRRTFLRDLGQGTLAIAVLGATVISCSSDAEEAPATGSSVTSGPGANPEAVTWSRVDLGNVSAYVLVRRGEAAVVDTGNPGNLADIAAALDSIAIGWENVSHVIVTHLHGDHIGSLEDVMTAAPDALGYAGAPDIPGIPSPRPLTPVGDGDRVFGLQIIATPGHTPGSISVLDPVSGLLLAGDALNGQGGGVTGANPRYSADMDVANSSVRKLAALQFDTVVFGHGEPVAGGAAAQVAALAASL
jgi:glyoxylase-like metal-dependent hydrolase (beta-lactamase superfamily II)